MLGQGTAGKKLPGSSKESLLPSLPGLPHPNADSACTISLCLPPEGR